MDLSQTNNAVVMVVLVTEKYMYMCMYIYICVRVPAVNAPGCTAA